MTGFSADLAASPAGPASAELRSADPKLERAAEGIDASRRLGRILRIVGGAFLIASASTFLLHRWEQGSDLIRYGMLLLHTVLLTAAALFCGLGVKESRGARTFLAITLSVVPINAAVLGGLVYSRFAQDSAHLMLAGNFLWVAPSGVAALSCVVATAVVLAPAVWIAYRTLAKPRATSLLCAFALLNGLLILPWRLPAVTSLLAVLGTLVVAVADAHWFSRHPAARTVEGRIARGTLLLPLALLLARGMHLYPSFLLQGGALFAGAGTVLAAGVSRVAPERRRLTGVFSLLALALGWLCWWLHLCDAGHTVGVLALPSLLLPLSALFIRSGRGSETLGPACRAVAALLAISAVVPNLWLYPGLWTLLACASVGALTLAVGAWVRSKLLTLSGLLAVGTAIAYQIGGNLDFQHLKHWAVLSSLGILLIIVASYWERYQTSILRRVGRWRALAREWEY
ncbi:MAG TPA: hypothetical protein VFU02_11835 [Polyangiaceae bacterium]|nr:hypothetical protein [Polyangiaceae bacterium]